MADLGGGAADAPSPLYNFKNDFFFLEILCKKSSSDRPNPYVFGIIGKLLENAREWF